MIPINFLAVLIAAVVAFILGFLAHGPIGGKLWIKLANIHPTGKEKFSDMIPQMIANLVVNIICAYVLAVVYAFASTSPYMNTTGAWSGIVCALWIWFGFSLTATIIDVIWMGKSKKLWLFEAVSSLVVFIAMGAIIGGM
jgi:hypothetical protein